MKTEAAVLVELGQPLVLAELVIPPLKPGQVLVEVVFSGICHTQLLEIRGYRGQDRYLPHCLGHEGSGIVRQTGPSVTKVKSGDRVILSWIKGSGADVPGTTYRWEDRTVNAGAITTFSRYSVISENRLTILPDGIDMREAAALGCAVPTGMGAIFNTARPRPGQSIAIFGVGGIGLCAVAAAAISGCLPIIAVDIRSEKLALARQLGATECINAETDNGDNVIDTITRLCPGGVELAIKASGRPAVMVQALKSVCNQGGTAVVIGNARQGEYMQLDPKQLNLGKRLLGTWGGDNWPDRDYPRYCKLLSSGKLNLKPLLLKAYALREINDAIDDLEGGRVQRPLLDLSMD